MRERMAVLDLADESDRRLQGYTISVGSLRRLSVLRLRARGRRA